jgi:Zn-dependent protease with chaperone function
VESIIVKVSDNFKQQVVKTVYALVLFVLIYLLLVISAVALTLLLAAGGIAVVMLKPSFLTLVVGFGLVSIGILIIIFLLKFMFSGNKVDRSNMLEIDELTQPKLYQFIQDIAKQVNTQPPKRIYLSQEVNAAVFYDSTFWSMFFPIRKNLIIGLGLVNGLDINEFKAVLAHEFGHFSQSSMKVGSFVYNVNKVIHNILYDNNGYQSLAQSWANLGTVISIAVNVAMSIAAGIQKLLQKIYEYLNKNYSALSREMEFHADAVAANITGSDPLINALLRLEFVEHSYQLTLGFYDEKVEKLQKTSNLYANQKTVMNYLINADSIPLNESQLPIINSDTFNKFNKSKLNIEDQWASHPSTEDRVSALKQLNISKPLITELQINELFLNLQEVQNIGTNKLFANVVYKGRVENISLDQFEVDFKNYMDERSFHPSFNGYYDNKNPSPIQLDEINLSEAEGLDMTQLFSKTYLDNVIQHNAVLYDLQRLTYIQVNKVAINSFDYDGVKYNKSYIPERIRLFELESKDFKSKIQKHDVSILTYFYKQSIQKKRDNELAKLYNEYLQVEGDFANDINVFNELLDTTNFISQQLEYGEIKRLMVNLKQKESSFRINLSKIINNANATVGISPAILEECQNYLAKDMKYFSGTEYHDEQLNVFFGVLRNYNWILNKSYFNIKKQLLDFFIQLENT